MQKAKYISGTLQIHFIHCDYSDMCTFLTFYDTSEDGALIGKVSYKDTENVCCSSESSDNMPSSSSDIGYNIDDFVEVIYEGETFPGKVVAIPDKVNITVKCLVKVAVPGSVWKWPAKDDIADYALVNVVRKINVPTLLPGGGRKLEFSIPELAE